MNDSDKSSQSHQTHINMTHKRQFRFALLRWHRRLGVLVALLVLPIAISGMLLNHTEALRLDQRYINSSWLLSWYGIETQEPQVAAFPLGVENQPQRWVVQWNNDVFLDALPVFSCDSLVGARRYGEEVIIACADSLWLVNAEGEVVEHLGESFGLPVPLQGLAKELAGELGVDYLGLEANKITLLGKQGQAFQLDWNNLRFEMLEAEAVNAVDKQQLPAQVASAIQAQLPPAHSIHWERLLLDIHSGRFLGSLGVWLFDVAALVLIFLAVSGLWVWGSRK